MKDKIHVLYIDDEDHNLSSFRASLRKDFKVYTAINADEGLKLIQENEFHVVIADQRMPAMSGVEFFEQLVKINPAPIRILLTGYSDIASAIDAINKGEVYRYIDKPWNIEQIKNAIFNAADIYFTRRELKEKNEKLAKANSEMSKFVYSLSHDLRGPLMSISAVSKLAQTEFQDPDVLEYFELIDSATIKLDDFIHKMMDFYRSTKMGNKIVPIKFEDILEQQLAEYKSKLTHDGISFALNINQNEVFYSDEAKVRVILNNIISNAYKFQKEEELHKKIDLSIKVHQGIALITITDNGIGIEKDHQKEVFNLFPRASHRNIGAGLGLYMVKESVDQINGQIQLESQINEGTVVEISIPNMEQP